MKRLRLVLILALFVCAAPITQSCSSHEETKTVQTTTAADPPPGQTTTTTTTTTESEPDSVLGATFHAIGTIIAFPFRLIGDALGLIF